MKLKKTISIIISIVLIFLIGISIYLGNYYKAEQYNYSFDSEEVKIKTEKSGYYFDGPNENDLIIFYPGAKVETSAYIPLLYELSKEYDCYLVDMPFHMAILNKNAADNIIKKYKYENYYLMGHSLGGAVAAMYTNKNDKIKGLILLSAYPTKKLNDNLKMLSIYGTNDKVLNKKKYEKNKKYWNKNSTEVIIKGANHANFGNYGKQKGDGKASIERKTQQSKTVKAIINFIN